jgi:hypothetical protein
VEIYRGMLEILFFSAIAFGIGWAVAVLIRKLRGSGV